MGRTLPIIWGRALVLLRCSVFWPRSVSCRANPDVEPRRPGCESRLCCFLESGYDLEQMARQRSSSLDLLTERETRCPQLRVFVRIKRGRLGSAQHQMTLAKYSLYFYRYHLNQSLAAGLEEKPLLPHTGLSPQSWQLRMEGAAPQKTVDIWFETRV